MSTPPLAASGMAPGPFAGPQAQQAAREVNTASLCRIGQETVQDIVYRTMEIFQLLRNMQQLIPYVEEDGSKDDRAGPPRFASEERREIAEVNKKLKQKNQQLKQIMDQLRNLIWDINAMLAMRN
ncbi:mediator of RNA polymerase II transcription subunit 30 isoform X3 [Ovis aries]|uniref:mediator of RNA polymerase II transcription subunit 30 isoform X2 n=1 Tax=Capra hircus TaxID=9925 RepID=UPI000846F266|nr:PREDICTED: mediator of RNA polymerase II transcription subunit 30 isoform X2 [Capra hircus]XP_042110306.1 mediator of RNA polymerase II transcription subunit 30 isoform X3 [Ovis aries]XP_055402342.1 mediator of RNA polymerase II transcription subunit 30 isoform X3 [Bubalus carabanensis]